MSDRKNLIIEADDITLIQGEAIKEYYVKVTSDDGNPLESIPLNITFYNDEQSMVNQATTNEYGIASMPLILCGGSWFVDVHFVGNNEYKPFVVTKNVIIEKFTRLDSSIASENLVINIDDVSMDGTYYTITLTDANNLPIVDEPVSITVAQTGVDDPTTYLDIVLKTDANGKIEVPFQSYNENVVITSNYKGCTRYKPCTNADIVAFEDVDPRNTIEFRLGTIGGILAIQYKIGNGSWGELSDEDRVYLNAPIVNKQNDNRTSHSGWFYVDSMATGTYKITLSFDGITESDGEFSNLYPFCKTFTFNNTTDTRKSLGDFVASQGGTNTYTQTMTNNKRGDYNHIHIEFDFELPFEPITLLSSTLVQNYEFKTVPQYKNTDNPYRKSILEYDVVNNPNEQPILYIYQNANDHIQSWSKTLSISFSNTTKADATLTQTGFGYNRQTYQSIDVLASNSNASMHDKINEYYIMKMLNTDTLEEFYFYSYLVDNVTASHDEFELGLGNWRMEIVSKDTANYKGAYLLTTAELTTEDRYYNTDDFFYNADNWNEYGLDHITINEPTITTVDSNTTISITDEYTQSNNYSLGFEVEIDNNSIGSILIGSDPQGTEFIGIRNGYLTLTKNNEVIDEIRIESNISGNWEIQRTGNTFNIICNNQLVYTTTEISYNTFGLQNGATTIRGIGLKTTAPTGDITPSTQDYDGTVFGSNWHLEFRGDHLNFTDYGMLPSGAVGGGLVLLNDVALPKDKNWGMEITTTYNNSRYDARLNTLYGEIQARTFEDVSTSDSTLEYANVLCSPSPIPNAKTIFTRHSEEGTLYFVKPLDVIATEQGKTLQKPSYLCNAYNQYKGGVQCYTETGISLFSMDNQHSPVYVGNNLVRAEFHRRSGYIVISRWDENTSTWYSANVLKLSDNLKLSLAEYNDDYARVNFGATTWEFYRGRPFIIVKHPNTDIRILKLVDRVYCETIDNEQSMGFIEEHNTYMSEFNPQFSIQQFKKELHIGENIQVDNFDLYEVDSNNNLIELEHNASIGTIVWDNKNALVVDKGFNGKLAVNFPSSSQYVKKPSSTFSLLIGKIDVDTETSITVKARGFDENGAIHIRDGVQYGLWEQSQTFTVNSATEEIRATFVGCPNSVKYIDFVVILNTTTTSQVKMTDLMCYQGDSEPNWNIDTSMTNAYNVELVFKETYYANLYFEDAPIGLCVIRPLQEPFTLTNLKASSETVLAPYMKKCKEWDKPQQVFLEYLNSKRQTIDINWEEF